MQAGDKVLLSLPTIHTLCWESGQASSRERLVIVVSVVVVQT